MENNMNAIGLKEVFTVMSLNFKEYESEFCMDRTAEQVCNRLKDATAALHKGEFIGLEVTEDAEGRLSASAFSSLHAGMTGKDAQWIFDAETGDGDIASFEEGFWSGRNIYSLVQKEDDDESYMDIKDNWNWYKKFISLLELLKEMGECYIRLVSFGGDSYYESGLILISLPGTMPLRMKAAMQQAFPELMISHWKKEDGEIDDVLSYRHLRNGLVCFLQLMTRQKNIGSSFAFGNSECHAIDLDEYEDSSMMLEQDEPGFMQNQEKESKDYMAELNGLIGLEPIKEQVRNILAFAKMKAAMKDSGTDLPVLSLNMEFTGNPGTAKTTVARILAGLFYEAGLLESPKCVEVGRTDLIAGYVGQTAMKVQDVFEGADGKLLFIDEAYSLVDYHHGSYGDEAIDTIVQEMENRRDRTIVIFAGYPDEMEKLFSRNPGLRSRVPFHINFDDYSAEEMLEICKVQAKEWNFSISDDADDKVLSLCGKAKESENSGNGRFCRNLVENAIMNYATRVYGKDNSETPATNLILTNNDFKYEVFKAGEREKRSIGFS